MLHGSGCLDEIHTTAESLFAAGGGAGGATDALPRLKLSAEEVRVGHGPSSCCCWLICRL